ncbi:hypothetical protein MFLAVUS_004796 [Mucor flavus]|uniref:E3 ubiquitin protein ligase n=1 Tax=Mucor flavus TaxID=439312 RepID=A0ABP9YWW7_9FUNG
MLNSIAFMSRPPPLKKRLKTDLEQPDSNKEENPLSLITLKHVSKQELLEKMRSTKQEYLAVKNKALFQDDSKLNNPNTIRLLLNLLRDEFASDAKVIGNPSLSTNSDPDDMKVLLQETKKLSTYIVNEIKSWNTKVDNVQAVEGNQQWVGFIQSETTSLLNSHPVISHYLVELQNDYNVKLRRTDSILNEIKSLSEQLKMKQEELQDCVESIEVSEKRYDRSQSKIVAELTCEQKEETPVPVPVSIQSDVPKEAVDTQTQLDKYKFLIDIRTREVIALEKDIGMLQSTLDGLFQQVETISDDKILGSNFVHHLESSIDFHYGRIDYYKHKIDTLKSEQDRLKIERKSLRDRFESEKSSQESTWATEMKNLKNNLERITSQYNYLKQSFHTQLLKENKIKEENDMVINEVNSQKQRMMDLEKEVEFKRKEDGLILAVEEANKLKQILDQINQYEDKRYLTSAHETIQSLKQSFERLSNTHSDQIDLLHNLLKQKQALLLMIEFFENTERQLYTQIDCDGRVYEGRVSLITAWTNKKSEQLMQLQAENLKYSQTFPALIKEADKIKKNINNLKRTNQQQAELIRLRESEEQVLVSQVNEQETLIRKLECKIEQCRLEVDDYTQESEEIAKRLKVFDTQQLSLQKLTIEKVKFLDQEISLGKQVRDDYEKLKRKWTMISNGENSASQELIDEVEDLRAQFKCKLGWKQDKEDARHVHLTLVLLIIDSNLPIFRVKSRAVELVLIDWDYGKFPTSNYNVIITPALGGIVL